jgi:amino acid adenylation domain-containing protein
LTTDELLERLTSLGISLTAVDGKLRVNAARGQLSDELKSAIAGHRDELLRTLPAQSTNGSRIARVSRAEPLQLSFFQERLWVVHRFDPENTAYNLVIVQSTRDPVDMARLEAAIRTLARRHESIRYSFKDNGALPSIVLQPADAIRIDVVDLRDRSETEQEQSLEAAVDAAAHTPFDLANEAAVRFIVLRRWSEGISLLIVAHHIAVDAWSLELLRREVVAAYAGELQPNDHELQYADFAAWQRRTQDAQLIRPDLDWWAAHLAGAPALSTFPPDGVHGPAPRARGATHTFSLSAERSASLRAMVREEGTTLYTALLAACAVVLQWYTGQQDIVLGSPMGMRDRPEFERIVGPFVNVLVLRLGLADDPTFAQLLARARNEMLDVHERRDVSFERIVERIHPARSLDHSPIFQVAVVLHNATGEASEGIRSGGALFDLTWFVRENSGRLECGLEYRTDLYSAEAVAQIARRLEGVLDEAVKDRHRKVSTIPLVAAAESEQLLGAFNATAVDLDPRSFAEQFARQAAATPNAQAVSFNGDALSYAGLNARSDRVARHLRATGIARGDVVGLCMPRSLEMLGALIGIHKSGAAYLPLDPDFPAERLNYMLSDSGARAIVFDRSIPAKLQMPAGVTAIDVATIDGAAIVAAESSAEGVGSSPESSDLAYIIYTSGSTGRPKGVEISHGALANFLGAMRREPGITPSDKLAAVTTLSFDIAALELYLPLVAGAEVVLVPRDVAVDGNRLVQLIDSHGITMLQATPATWRLLIEAGWRGRTDFRALTGGEALPPELADALLDRAGEVWNMYGPTETTVWSTVARVRRGEPITIGRPIANTRVYVLGAERQLMPVGMAGELWIGGRGVAIGYHDRPELTAERFVVDPFDRSGVSARMYRTGDRARWRTDGSLEHMGRLDEQVKIRGYRIEPGEIEAVLEAHPAVVQAVVVPRRHSSGDVRLVAYLIYASGQDLSVSEVRRLLRAQLPDYMVPSMFVTVDAIPLTPNGKVDRKALPDPFLQAANVSAVERTPPAPGLETLIADIWRNVLGITAVSAEDNFFDLGGHSLLALRVVGALQQATGWRMDPRLLFFQQLRQIAAAAPSPVELSSTR